MIRKLPHWIKQGKAGKPTDMRYLMRDYVLILANTGMRHGTEALNLNCKHTKDTRHHNGNAFSDQHSDLTGRL
jgi:hypothetical protein